MPTIYVDPEGAELVEAALQMFEAALTARVKRVDPGYVISNSLKVQQRKLETTRRLLKMPDPGDFTTLPESLQNKALGHARLLIEASDQGAKNVSWAALRQVLMAHEIR